jgi:TonB family protein
MNWPIRVKLLTSVLALGAVCFAASKKEEEANSLIERAKQLSDIRAESAPPFRLKVGLRMTGKGVAANEGTYTETWASSGQWRTEAVVGDFRRTAVANGKKRWTLSNNSAEPTDSDEIGFQMGPIRYSPDFWKPGKLEDREIDSVAVRCIETKSDPSGGKAVLCFDKAAGTILTKIRTHQVGDRVVKKECTYQDYLKFGEKMFPRTIRCVQDRVPVLEQTVLELIAQPAPDAALFGALTGGTESTNCPGVIKRPTAVYTPNPVPPKFTNSEHPVVLWLIVGTDGAPRDVKVARSVDKAFDGAALEAVQRWKFKPATCDGEPIEVQINVNVNFQVFGGNAK